MTEYILSHWDDILVGVTLVMSAIVGVAHGLAWIADILVRLSLLTSTKEDDKHAARFLGWAQRMSRGADWLSRQHSRLMPRARIGGGNA